LALVSKLSAVYPHSQNHSRLATLRYDLAMPPVPSSDLPASMAILGLLVRKSDTAAGIGIRLAETFPRADWHRSTVPKNMPSLVTQRLVKRVSKGAEPGADQFEATAKGVTHFLEWVRDSADPFHFPPMRDVYQGRLSFAEWDDLEWLVGSVRAAEASYRVECAAAQGRVKAIARVARRALEPDWRSKLAFIQSADEAVLMGMMLRRFQKLGDELERLLEEETD
jgi:hypothetical protein